MWCLNACWPSIARKAISSHRWRAKNKVKIWDLGVSVPLLLELKRRRETTKLHAFFQKLWPTHACMVGVTFMQPLPGCLRLWAYCGKLSIETLSIIASFFFLFFDQKRIIAWCAESMHDLDKLAPLMGVVKSVCRLLGREVSIWLG